MSKTLKLQKLFTLQRKRVHHTKNYMENNCTEKLARTGNFCPHCLKELRSLTHSRDLHVIFPPYIVFLSAACISHVCIEHLHFLPHTSCPMSKMQLDEATKHLACGNHKAGEREQSLITARCCCSYWSSMLRCLIRNHIVPSCSITVERNTTEVKQVVCS